MGKMIYAATVMALTAFLAAPLFAADPPADAGVKGLWIKATNLPKEELSLEDFTEDEGDEPYFVYLIGRGPDGPAATMAVTRYPQDANTEKIAALDKKALSDLVGSDNFLSKVKNLKFEQAPKLSEKFSYPCQLATFEDPEMNLSVSVLFIQTDPYMFSAQVTRTTGDKNYSEAEVEKWLMNIELVEQGD